MRGSRRSIWVISLLLVLSLIAAACGGDDGGTDTGDTEGVAEGERTRGGTLTWMYEEFGFVGGFDPVGEYLGDAWTIMNNLLIRNLVSYKHVAGEEGNEIVPDLVEELPEPTENGTVYEFTLKDGVTFGPPVDREIVCDDVEYAFRRIATESLVAQYANYYVGVIKGLEVGEDPGKGGIPGVECVDEKTVRFTLTQPQGDFFYRLAMPAAAPVPEEVAGCFDEAGEYGRYIVSSAGYMIEGADQAEADCKTIKPYSGYNPTKFMKIVRRPGYEEEQATDEYRGNYIDAWELVINTNTNDIEQSVETGENDFVYNPTPQTLRKFVTDPELKDRLHINSGDRTWYLTMNLNEPPFDDIHIRKAVNLVMDKDALRRQAWGGETAGEIATHIIPDVMLQGGLSNEEYNPYPSPNHQGDPEAAAEEVKQSKYDENGDGKCDEAPECQGVLTIGSNTPPGTEMHPIIEESLKKIGISLEIREVTDAYTPITTVAKRVPFSTRPGWGKDYPDVYTFVGVLFSGENLNCVGNYNYSLVGLTPEKAKECKIPFNNPDMPSVDEDIEACLPLQGEERTQCWIDLDKKIMEEVVPWVPYLHANAVWATSPEVEHYEFDQFASTPAWANISLNEGGGE